MKKRIKSTALSVLLAAAILVGLIPLGAASVVADGEGAVLDVTNAQELKAALDRDTPVQAINIVADFTVNDDCTILYTDLHIDQYHDTVLTIAEGVTLRIGAGGLIGSCWPSYGGDWETPPLPNGRVINNGTVIVEEGGATEYDFDTNNGKIIVKDGGAAICCTTNNGTVIVEGGGLYNTSQGQNAVNHGSIEIQHDAVMTSRFGSSIVNAEDGEIQLDGDFWCGCVSLDSDDVCWFENRGKVTGNGSIILYQAMPVDDMDAMIENVMAQLGQQTRFENWDDINIYKYVEVSDYDQLAAALPGDRTVAGEQVEGDMDVMIELSDDVVIPEGASIKTMAMITVPDWLRLTVQSGGLLECGLENDGEVKVESGGKLYTTMGSHILNRGVMLIEEGAQLKSQMGSPIINEDNATLTIDGECWCGCIGFEGDDDCWFENRGSVDGAGAIILYEIEPDFMPVDDMDALAKGVREQIDGTSETLPEVRIAAGIIAGDVDGKEGVTAADALMALQAATGKITLTADQTAAADVDGQDSVTAADALMILQYATGKIDSFPVQAAQPPQEPGDPGLGSGDGADDDLP
ncbi:MAG: dockerin type I repeat-containing protein [Acutalibacteraceae bacterium]|jgi:hypothetical protein